MAWHGMGWDAKCSTTDYRAGFFLVVNRLTALVARGRHRVILPPTHHRHRLQDQPPTPSQPPSTTTEQSQRASWSASSATSPSTRGQTQRPTTRTPRMFFRSCRRRKPQPHVQEKKPGEETTDSLTHSLTHRSKGPRGREIIIPGVSGRTSLNFSCTCARRFYRFGEEAEPGHNPRKNQTGRKNPSNFRRYLLHLDAS